MRMQASWQKLGGLGKLHAMEAQRLTLDPSPFVRKFEDSEHQSWHTQLTKLRTLGGSTKASFGWPQGNFGDSSQFTDALSV